MGKKYGDFGRQAEDAVRGIKDKDLRREAFRILLLQLMAGGEIAIGKSGNGGRNADGVKRGPGRPRLPEHLKVTRKPNPAAKRPGRRGGGVATVAIQKMIDVGSFRTGRDAAGIMKELAKKRVILQPSQLRMVLLRFSRAKKLKRRIKMKGKKVTYLYSEK
jgi:hypothetical protein